MADSSMDKFCRFLYLGDEDKSYPLSVSYPFNPDKTQLLQDVEANPRELGSEAINKVLQIYRDGHFLGCETIIYALALYGHSKDSFTKQAAFKAVSEVCSDAASLLTFTHIYKELSKPTTGWNRTHRKLLIDWYNNKEAKDLAVEVTKVKSRHKWSHKDVLCMAHVKAKNSGVGAVLKYAVKGLEVAKKEYGTEPETEPVLNYLKGVFELTHTPDTHVAARLIEIHDLCLEHVPPKLLKSKEVSLCLIPRITLEKLLELLPHFNKYGLLNLNNSHYTAVLERLTSEETLKDRSVDPLQTFLAIRKWQISNKVLPGKSTMRESTPAIDDALQNLHQASFKTVSPTGKHFLVALDIRLNMNHNHCAGCTAITPSHVSDIILMALVQSEVSDVTVVAFSAQELVAVEINNKMTLGDIVEQISNITAGPVNLAMPIRWALEKKKSYDMFIVFSDILSNSEDGDSAAALSEYKETMHLPNARYIVSSLCDSTSSFKHSESSMLNLVGFNIKLLKVIQDFARGIF